MWKKESGKRDRAWAALQAGLVLPATLASHKLAVKAWTVLTGEDPPIAGTAAHGKENKETLRRFVAEVINKQSPEAIDQFVAESYLEHSPIGQVPPTREGLRDSLGALFAAFPDFRSEEQGLLAERDEVVYRGLASGTHQGEFMGAEGTGRRFEISEVHIARLADGKLVEHWAFIDFPALQQQLGLATAQPPRSATFRANPAPRA